MREHFTYPDSESCGQALAARVAVRLQREIEGRGQASLVVPGGATPQPFLRALSQQCIEWEKVMVTLTDERWVPPDHPQSNERLIRQELLTNYAAACHFVSLWCPGMSPEDGLPIIKQRLEVIPKPFTAVVLGVGGDGHVASLFPEYAPFARVGDTCEVVRPPRQYPRVSLTLAALCNSAELLLLFGGEHKLEIFDRVRRGAHAPPFSTIYNQPITPVTAFTFEQTPGLN